LILEILDTAILLDKIFLNSELAGEKKLETNQNNQKAKLPDREMIKNFLPRRDQEIRFA
jgi:hypothetical protein